MEEINVTLQRPRRRHRTKQELFKEAYLPYLILLAAAILILSFIIGTIQTAGV